jgi:uncharacterized damage-inducible protein DinB
MSLATVAISGFSSEVGKTTLLCELLRVLHTAQHRTQLTIYLRLLGKDVPATYGPTADVTWEGADPTRTVQAASRR